MAGEKTPFSAHPGLFLYGRSLVGTLFGGLKPKSDLPKMVDMYMQKVCSLIGLNVINSQTINSQDIISYYVIYLDFI